MPERGENAGEKTGRRALLKLLRLLLRGECRIVAEDARCVRIEREGEGGEFAATILAQGLMRGLVHRNGRIVTAMPAASAYLRRALAGGEAEFAGQHRDMVE